MVEQCFDRMRASPTRKSKKLSKVRSDRISARAGKMLDHSAINLKKGLASTSIVMPNRKM
jgi:hypothetical protein